jgi:hypothetical protein
MLTTAFIIEWNERCEQQNLDTAFEAAARGLIDLSEEFMRWAQECREKIELVERLGSRKIGNPSGF